MFATCIAFRSTRDIDVQFEDGTIVKHKSSSSFRDGKIANPNVSRVHSSKANIEGMTLRMNNGMNATCIAYRGSLDIDVQFEDDSIVKKIESKDNGINVYIGDESEFDKDVTVIKTKYHKNGEEGTIAVIGPKRMEYDRVVGMLEYMKKNIER